MIERSRCLALAACLLFSVCACAQKSEDWTRCENKDGAFSPDLVIGGCTAVIQLGGESDKNIAVFFHNRGVAYHLKGNDDRAIQDFDESLRLNPKNAVFFDHRGIAYSWKDEYVRAIQDFDEAIRLEPKNASAFQHRGLAYVYNDQYDRGIKDIDEAIRLNPQDAESFSARGVAYRQKQQYDRAIQDFDEAIRLDPKNVEAFSNRCRARVMNSSEPQSALSDCDEALRLAPTSPYALMARGFAYLKLGQLDRAIADYDTALSLQRHQIHKAYSLYGRGIGKRQKGDKAGGDADITAARAIYADVAKQFAKFGISETPPLSFDEVLHSLKNGISAVRMKALVAQYGAGFDLDKEKERQLRAAGANDGLLYAITQNKK